MSKKADPAKLSELAWELLDEAMNYGTMTLPNAKSYSLDAEQQLAVVKWLANLDKKPKFVPKPEDFLPKKTGGKQ